MDTAEDGPKIDVRKNGLLTLLISSPGHHRAINLYGGKSILIVDHRPHATRQLHRHTPELKGSIGEGPNHSNHSNSFKIQEMSLENSKISENFNIF